MQRIAQDSTAMDATAVIEKLRQEHAALDARLEQLKRNVYLTPEEEAEVSLLKRQKLQKKDMIHRLSCD